MLAVHYNLENSLLSIVTENAERDTEAKRFYADTVSATQEQRHSATPPAVTQSAPDDLAILDRITF